MISSTRLEPFLLSRCFRLLFNSTLGVYVEGISEVIVADRERAGVRCFGCSGFEVYFFGDSGFGLQVKVRDSQLLQLNYNVGMLSHYKGFFEADDQIGSCVHVYSIARSIRILQGFEACVFDETLCGSHFIVDQRKGEVLKENSQANTRQKKKER